MHTRSRTRSVAVPRPPQSVAPLLPPEIVDCIFSHFDLDYSINATGADETERTSNLSNMSVISKGWKGPARRRLCRTVCVWRWDRLAEGVPEWARGGLRNVEMTSGCWKSPQTQEAAGATFRFLKDAPNLRLLRLDYLPFHSFDTADSAVMRTTHLLPHLRDFTVVGDSRIPQSVISDILAASNRQVSHLHLWNARRAISPIPSERLDFGGNLQSLRLGGHRPIEDFQPLPRGLVGLREMRLAQLDGQSGVRARELLAEVAPSLEKLTIDSGDVNEIVVSFPLLTRLTRLSLSSVPASPDSPLLPPSLVSLQFVSDENLLPLLDRWNAEPSLLPAPFQQINIRRVHDHRTFTRLPPFVRFGTRYQISLIFHLRRLASRTLPFKALEVYFDHWYLDEIEAVEAECKRLEVAFSRRMEDDWA